MNKIRIVFIYVLMIVTLFSCSKIEQEKTVTTKETEKSEVQQESAKPPKSKVKDLTSVIDWNGDVHCFDINVNDSAEVVKEKLTKYGKEYESKVDLIGMFQLWNPGYNPEEGIDMDFCIKFFEDTLYVITKSSQNSEDIQNICDKIGIKIKVKRFKQGELHKYKYDKWRIHVSYERKYYTFQIFDKSRNKNVIDQYMMFQ